MNAKLLIIVIAIIVGGGAGYFFGYDHGWEKALVKHAQEEMKHGGGEVMEVAHPHEQVEAPPPAPSVDLVIHQDSKSGWNAQIILTDFSFAPEHVSTNNIPGEGHAHIYVDGEKINRVYGEWYHLGMLTAGAHVVAVRLSTNDHKELIQGGEPIADNETVEVSSDGADAMQVEHMDVQ